MSVLGFLDVRSGWMWGKPDDAGITRSFSRELCQIRQGISLVGKTPVNTLGVPEIAHLIYFISRNSPSPKETPGS